MKETKKQVLVYLLITFVLSWTLQGIVIGVFHMDNSIWTAGLLMVVMFMPLVGSFLTSWILKEKRDMSVFRFSPKKNLKYYACAWFLPLILSFLGSTLFFSLNPTKFDPQATLYQYQLGNKTLLGFWSILGTIIPSTLLGGLVNMVMGSIGEEVGWRGYLMPHLEKLHSPKVAVVETGIIWGLWHAPLVMNGYNYGKGYVGYPFLGVVVMVISCIAVGIFFSWLMASSHSIWTCALAHGTFNATGSVGLLFVRGVTNQLIGPSPVGLLSGLPMMVLAFILIYQSKVYKGPAKSA